MVPRRKVGRVSVFAVVMSIFYLKAWCVSMKYLRVSLLAAFLVFISVVVCSSEDNTTKQEKCEKQRIQCTQAYLTTNSFGVQMVTSEGHRVCWEAYHQCMGD